MIDVRQYKDNNERNMSVSSSQRTASTASSRTGMTRILTDFSEKCSVVGVPFIRGAKSPFERGVWIFLLLLAIAVMGLHLQKLFSSYFSYEKNTKISLGFDNLKFPAVTFCNVNTMRASMLRNASKDLQELVETFSMENMQAAMQRYQPQYSERDDYYPDDLPGSTNSKSQPTKLRESNFFDDMPVNVTVKSPRASAKSFIQEDFQDSWESECDESTYGAAQDMFKEMWVAMPPENRIALGHQIQDMLIQCSFAGGQCLMGNFTPLQSASYGNCYTIQYDKWISRRSGPDEGLELILFLETDEYIPAITIEKGIQLVIHEQGTLAFPDNEGIAVAAGTQTVIGLRQLQVSRLGNPYGGCNEPEEFLKKYKVKYTRNTCQKVCEQNRVQSECNCYDELAQQILSVLNISKNVPPCRSEAEIQCLTKIQFTFSGATDNCGCNSPCKETQFEKTISSRQWPSVDFAKIIIEMICKDDPDDSCLTERNNKTQMDLTEDFIKLKIYFEDLNYEKYSESPAYELTQFLSDVGGTIGLYIGLSVLGIFEIFHLIIDIFHFCCFKKRVQVK